MVPLLLLVLLLDKCQRPMPLEMRPRQRRINWLISAGHIPVLYEKSELKISWTRKIDNHENCNLHHHSPNDHPSATSLAQPFIVGKKLNFAYTQISQFVMKANCTKFANLYISEN